MIIKNISEKRLFQIKCEEEELQCILSNLKDYKLERPGRIKGHTQYFMDALIKLGIVALD